MPGFVYFSGNNRRGICTSVCAGKKRSVVCISSACSPLSTSHLILYIQKLSEESCVRNMLVHFPPSHQVFCLPKNIRLLQRRKHVTLT